MRYQSRTKYIRLCEKELEKANKIIDAVPMVYVKTSFGAIANISKLEARRILRDRAFKTSLEYDDATVVIGPMR